MPSVGLHLSAGTGTRLFLSLSLPCMLNMGEKQLFSFISFCALLLQIMAVPPTYVDLGKSAKDVFTKGYGEQHNSSDTLSVYRSFDREKMNLTLMKTC